ncbi:hypothetical protein EVAR_59893_1 [Eumeta japonica]|uniref:Uncharacterized protein n=1 Tax=Eumeta variegata TaxID=151549 RepID=A0A4C2AIT3_EUMVA|nr:hypothetical protein EVAR_59893_1 [Eumeta japonica]
MSVSGTKSCRGARGLRGGGRCLGFRRRFSVVHDTRRRSRHDLADLRQRLRDAHLPQHFLSGGDLGQEFSILFSILEYLSRFSWLILLNLFSAASSSAALLAFSRSNSTTYLERDSSRRRASSLMSCSFKITDSFTSLLIFLRLSSSLFAPTARLPIADATLFIGWTPTGVDPGTRTAEFPPTGHSASVPPLRTATGGQSPPSGSPA